jgi:hypothetical protein
VDRGARLPKATRADRPSPALLHAPRRAAVGQLRAHPLQAARGESRRREARPPAWLPPRLGGGPGREWDILARHPATPRSLLASDDRHICFAHRAGEGGRRGDREDGAPRRAAVALRFPTTTGRPAGRRAGQTAGGGRSANRRIVRAISRAHDEIGADPFFVGAIFAALLGFDIAKAAVHETLRISHSTRERVRSISKDGNNGSQVQPTRHEQVAGSTPGPECPLPRRVERIPWRAAVASSSTAEPCGGRSVEQALASSNQYQRRGSLADWLPGGLWDRRKGARPRSSGKSRLTGTTAMGSPPSGHLPGVCLTADGGHVVVWPSRLRCKDGDGRNLQMGADGVPSKESSSIVG